jgi:hypothetical protein
MPSASESMREPCYECIGRGVVSRGPVEYRFGIRVLHVTRCPRCNGVGREREPFPIITTVRERSYR